MTNSDLRERAGKIIDLMAQRDEIAIEIEGRREAAE